MIKCKILAVLGIISIIASIVVGLIYEHDVAFIFLGTGIVMIGITTLSNINKLK